MLFQVFIHLNGTQATAGLPADGRTVANRARDEAANYRENYRSPPTLKVRGVSPGALVHEY
jgi:20S proteasome subunit alpha 7